MIVYGERALRGSAGARAAEHRRAPRPRRGRRRRAARDPGLAERPRRCARPASPRATARATRTLADARPRRRRHRRGARRRRAAHRLAAPRRPAAHLSRPRACGSARSATAQTVIARRLAVLTDTMREHADVVFPAEAYPEKEGTLVHPDGRLQRLRPAIGRPRGPRRPAGHRRARAAGRSSPTSPRALGPRARASSAPARRSSRRAVRGRAVLRRAHARGDRRPRRALAASAATSTDARRGSRPSSSVARRRAGGAATGACASAPTARCGRPRRSTLSPALHFLRARQVVELSPADAAALGIREGDRVEVGNGTRVPARRAAARGDPGRHASSSPRARARTARNVLTAGAGRGPPGRGPEPDRRVRRSPSQVQPAVEGLAEMPPSAPLPIPPREVT